FHQGPADLLPAALGGQVLQFPGLGQLSHQRQGVRRDTKTQRCIAGGKAGDAQYPQRVFGKGRRDMTQQAGLQVLLPPIGIDDLTLVIHGHGVDGQVAALQVLLQGDRGVGVEGEAAVAVTTLALGSGQRVLLAGVRVQEYREVLPDRAEAGLQQLIRRGADHYPVAFMPGHAQQLVTDGAADQIGIEVCFHRTSLGPVHRACNGGPNLPGCQIGGMFMSKRGSRSSSSLDRGGMCISSRSVSPSMLCRWISKPQSRCRCLSMRSVDLPSGLPSWRWRRRVSERSPRRSTSQTWILGSLLPRLYWAASSSRTRR